MINVFHTESFFKKLFSYNRIINMGLKRDVNTINKLMMFIEVAKQGQIKSTAFINGYKQSNLSKSIKDLEIDMGLTLFNRLQGGVSLTNDGKEVFEIACEISNALHKINTFKSSIHNTKGDIRLWSGDGLASGYISSALPDFYEKYPNIRIDFKCSMDSPFQLNETDIAIVYEKPKQNNTIIISEHLLSFGLFASKDYLAKYGVPKDLSDITEKHKICTRDNFAYAWKDWDDLISKAKFVCANTNSSNMLLELIKKGVGIGLLPINIGYEEQNLIRLSKLDINLTYPFWLITHKNLQSAPKIRALLEHIKKI